MPRPSTLSPGSTGAPYRKAVLFCPACDHESLVDGDWVLVEFADRAEYRCPDCETTITVRPVFDDPETPADESSAPGTVHQHALFSSWLRGWTTWWRVWTTWAESWSAPALARAGTD
ncbi:hypothetical protein ACFQH6_12660 [Halobacteriaceae archaeon GCM10025711]